MMEAARLIAEHGDLAHLVLFFWAASMTGVLLWTIRALIAANRRFDDFIQEISRLNKLFED